MKEAARQRGSLPGVFFAATFRPATGGKCVSPQGVYA